MANPYDQFDEPSRGGYVPLSPADPTTPLKVEQLRGQISGQGISRAKAAAELNRLNATAPYDARKAAADAAKAEAEAVAAKRAAGRNGLTAAQAQDAQDKLSSLSIMDKTLADLRKQYEDNFKGKGIQSVAERFAPGWMRPANPVFNARANQLSAFIADALGLSSKQFDTPQEQQRFVGSFIPQSSDTDEEIEAKLNALEEIARNGRRNIEAKLGGPSVQSTGVNTATTVADPGIPGGGTPPNNPGGPSPLAPPTLTISPTGGGVTGDVNADKPLREALAGLIRSGASRDVIDGFLRSQNADPATFKGLNDVLDWRDRNPGYKGSYQILPPMESRAPSTLGRVSGSPVGQFGRAAASGALVGLDDEIVGATDALFSGKPLSQAIAQANQAKQMGAAAFPTANTLGNVAGGFAALGAGGAGLARFAPRVAGMFAGSRALAPGALAGDALYGAAYGAGENNDNRLGGAALGAGLGAAGGVLGRGLLNTAGSVARGARGLGGNLLSQGGVSLTPGQRLGGAAKSFEDKLTSVPVLGDLIGKRRDEGLDAFNLGTFRQFDPSITATGTEGIKQARDVIDKAYGRALDGVRLTPDEAFARDYQGALALGGRIPGREKDYTFMVQQHVDPNMAEGEITGKGLQAALKGIRRDRRSLASQPRGADFADAASLMENALLNLAERGAPGTRDALAEANRLYGTKKILEDAVLAGQNTGYRFTPAQLGRSMKTNTKRFGGQTKAAEGDMPFFDWQQAGQDILPSKIASSGTADRAMAAMAIPGMLGGAGAAAHFGLIDPSTAATVAALSLPFTKTGMKAADRALSKRAGWMINLGDAAKRRARLGGMFGAPLLLQAD